MSSCHPFLSRKGKRWEACEPELGFMRLVACGVDTSRDGEDMHGGVLRPGID